ncbi:hypothetical protein A2U01_0039961, partial [Trifolium medium]|nr:hypothetical protein [Trifolium medium]
MGDHSRREFSFVIENMVDFDSFKANNLDIKPFFEKQGWITFTRLNGPVYPLLVRDFWLHATVVDGGLVGQKEIHSTIMGMDVVITQDVIAHVIGAPNEGIFEP